MLPEIFNYQGHGLAVFNIDGEPWFLAKEVCTVLEISNHRDAITRLSENMKHTVGTTDAIGRPTQVTLISEAGAYKLVFTSRKPEAVKFIDWLAEEVIPSIRKTGTYSIQPKLPQTYAEALRELATTWEENQKLLPKAEAFDQFMDGSNNQKMNVVAKTLGIGRNKLFELLRERRILMSDNTPYQEFVDRGYFVVKQKPIVMGEQSINKPQTFVTPKGVEYIRRLLNEQKAG
jgi:anti-repressor protein